MLGVASLEAGLSWSRSTASRSSPSTPIPCRPVGIPISNPGLSASGETASVVTVTYGPAGASSGRPYVSVISVHSPLVRVVCDTTAGVSDGAASP